MHLRRTFRFSTVMCLLLSTLLAACSPAASQSPTAGAPRAGHFRIAVILPSSQDFWTQSGLAALKEVEAQLGTPVVYTTDVAAEESAAVFRRYAEEGYNLIIGHGGQYIPSAEAVALEFPRVKFAIMGGSYPGNNVNVGGLDFKNDEAGYMMGIVAATKSTSNKVAFIGGVDQPEIVDMATSFELGARAVKPGIQVTSEYVGSWDDPATAQSQAQALVDAGYDVIAVDAGSGSTKVLDVAQAAGIYAVSTFVDESASRPRTILTTLLFNMSIPYLQAARLAQEGRWEARLYRLGFREGATTMTSFNGLLSAEQEQQVNATLLDMIAGEIRVTP